MCLEVRVGRAEIEKALSKPSPFDVDIDVSKYVVEEPSVTPSPHPREALSRPPLLLLSGETNIRLERLQVEGGEELVRERRSRWSHRGRGPPALNCDAPSMGIR